MIFDNIEFHNIEEMKIMKGSEGCRLLRIPETLRMQLSELGQSLGQFPNGAEMRFNISDGPVTVKLLWDSDRSPVDHTIAEVYYGSFQGGFPRIINRGVNEITIAKPANIDRMDAWAKASKLPFDTNLVRLILPFEGITHYIGVEGNVQPPKPRQVPGMRYLAYGSSITHGAAALSATGAYANRTAQYLGADLISMGFAGAARLEEEMAEYLAARNDWDFATFEMGINMLLDFDFHAFKARVDRFLDIIGQKHSDKWIFCIDIFTHEADFCDDGKTAQFREIVKQAVDRTGLPKLVHIPGTSLLKSVNGMTIDGIHPSVFGLEEIALNLSNIIKGYLFR